MLKKNQGFSLVQALVASVILSIGLLGLVKMQLENQKQVFSSYEKTLIGFFAQEMQARLRSNTCRFNPNNFNFKETSELTNYISSTLPTVVSSIYNSWQTDQADKLSRIAASLNAVFEPIGGKTSPAEIVKLRGAWEIEFNLSLAGDKTYNQKFSVDFLEDGCE